jgi:hypothetical protein
VGRGPRARHRRRSRGPRCLSHRRTGKYSLRLRDRWKGSRLGRQVRPPPPPPSQTQTTRREASRVRTASPFSRARHGPEICLGGRARRPFRRASYIFRRFVFLPEQTNLNLLPPLFLPLRVRSHVHAALASAPANYTVVENACGALVFLGDGAPAAGPTHAPQVSKSNDPGSFLVLLASWRVSDRRLHLHLAPEYSDVRRPDSCHSSSG